MKTSNTKAQRTQGKNHPRGTESTEKKEFCEFPPSPGGVGSWEFEA